MQEALAVVFGILVVALVVFGSMIVMADRNHDMMPMNRLMEMQSRFSGRRRRP